MTNFNVTMGTVFLPNGAVMEMMTAKTDLMNTVVRRIKSAGKQTHKKC